MPATVGPSGLARVVNRTTTRVSLCPGNIVKTVLPPCLLRQRWIGAILGRELCLDHLASDGMALDGSSQIRCGATF